MMPWFYCHAKTSSIVATDHTLKGRIYIYVVIKWSLRWVSCMLYFITPTPTPSYKVTFASINVTFNLTYFIRKWTAISKDDNVSHCSYSLPTRMGRGGYEILCSHGMTLKVTAPRMWHHIVCYISKEPTTFTPMIPLPWKRRQYFLPKHLLPIRIHGVTLSIFLCHYDILGVSGGAVVWDTAL